MAAAPDRKVKVTFIPQTIDQDIGKEVSESFKNLDDRIVSYLLNAVVSNKLLNLFKNKTSDKYFKNVKLLAQVEEFNCYLQPSEVHVQDDSI